MNEKMEGKKIQGMVNVSSKRGKLSAAKSKFNQEYSLVLLIAGILFAMLFAALFYSGFIFFYEGINLASPYLKYIIVTIVFVVVSFIFIKASKKEDEVEYENFESVIEDIKEKVDLATPDKNAHGIIAYHAYNRVKEIANQIDNMKEFSIKAVELYNRMCDYAKEVPDEKKDECKMICERIREKIIGKEKKE